MEQDIYNRIGKLEDGITDVKVELAQTYKDLINHHKMDEVNSKHYKEELAAIKEATRDKNAGKSHKVVFLLKELWLPFIFKYSIEIRVPPRAFIPFMLSKFPFILHADFSKYPSRCSIFWTASCPNAVRIMFIKPKL